MSLKAKLEAIIYAADEPVTIDQMAAILKDEISIETQDTAGEGSQESVAVDNGAKAKEHRSQARHSIRRIIDELTADYANTDRGMEIRELAGGYRMSTKPEHHDAVRAFAKSLKPPMRLSLQALETLAVIAYKQPVTAPEIGEIRGVDSSAVLSNLLARKLITTAGRKQVIGRPILYKTTKDFLLRFGLKDIGDLPSMEEFEKMVEDQADLFAEGTDADATGVPDVPEEKPEPNFGDAPGEDAEHHVASNAEGTLSGKHS
jgi:segregation and condensation protein B